jgi:hypothetical protein
METYRASAWLVALLLTPNSLPSQRPDTLSDADLAVRGITFQSDTIAVRRSLGDPLHVEKPASVGPYRSFVIWRYKSLSAVFQSGKLLYLDIVDPALATNRGAHVGDSTSRIRLLYGRPMEESAANMVYASSFAPAESRGIMFSLKAGRVVKITLGDVLSPLD